MKTISESHQTEASTVESTNATATTASTPADAKQKMGTVEFQIKEIDISRPARTVNRMWPNR